MVARFQCGLMITREWFLFGPPHRDCAMPSVILTFCLIRLFQGLFANEVP